MVMNGGIEIVWFRILWLKVMLILCISFRFMFLV